MLCTGRIISVLLIYLSRIIDQGLNTKYILFLNIITNNKLFISVESSDIMKRKVNLVGINTLTISLPKKWVDIHELKKGDELDLIEEGDSLIINSKLNTSHNRTLNMDITGLDRTSVLIAIRGAYRAGYDVIQIKFDKQNVIHHRTGGQMKLLSIIHETVNLLVGSEIVSQDEGGCVIKDFSANTGDELESTIRRIFLLLMESTSDFVKGLTKRDTFLVSTMDEKHDTISKFISYSIRMINKGAKIPGKRSEIIYHILLSLDNIMEVYRSSARDYIQFNAPKISAKTLKIIGEINGCLRIFYEMYYSFDNKKSSEFILRKGEIKAQILNKLDEYQLKELLIIHYMSHNLDLIWDLVLALRTDVIN